MSRAVSAKAPIRQDTRLRAEQYRASQNTKHSISLGQRTPIGIILEIYGKCDKC
jgi:hypothetical protein